MANKILDSYGQLGDIIIFFLHMWPLGRVKQCASICNVTHD